MILKYNLKQIFLGVLCLIGSAAAYYAAWLFFRYIPYFIVRNFGFRPDAVTMNWTAAGLLLLITLSGYGAWRKQEGFYGYQDSGLFHQLGEGSTAGALMEMYGHRVTGTAYMLSQIFLAGPLLALRAFSRFRSLIFGEPELEQKLASSLTYLKKINKWQNVGEHPEIQREILLLARMRKIDFSIAKGTPRIRAWSSDGI